MRVNDRVKDAPASALRALFTGIGQVLGMTDKLRAKSAASPEPKTDAPETAASKTAPAPAPSATAAPEAPASAAKTAGTVAAEPAAAEPAAAGAKPKAAPKPRAAAKPKPAAKPATSDASPAAGGHVKLLPPDAAPAPEPAAEPVATPAAVSAAGLPLANYEDLTVASLRARLRNLSEDQLTQLIAYERDHTGRTEVIAMFERRIAKLAEG